MRSRELTGRAVGTLGGITTAGWLAILAGAALVLDLLLVGMTGFDGLYGQDAFAYLGRARELGPSAGGDGGFLFADGYPAVVAGLSYLGVSTRVAAQAVSVLAGVGAVVVTFAIAREVVLLVGPPPRADLAGVLAGIVVLASAQRWQWSVAVMSDTLALVLAGAAAWSVLRFGRTGRLPWLAVAVVALSGAAATRFEYAVLAVPLTVAVALLGRSNGRRVGLPVAVIVVLLLPAVLLLAGGDTEALADHQWVRRWSPLNALRSGFSTPSGQVDLGMPVVLATLRAVVSPTLLGPLMSGLAAVGAWMLLRDARREGPPAWGTVAVLVGWPVAVFVVLVGIPFHNPRWSLSFLVPLAVLGSLGAWHVWAVVGRGWRRRAAALVIAVAVLGGFAWGASDVMAFVERKEVDLAAVRWIEDTLPPDEQVLAFGLTATLDHYTALTVDELYLLSEVELAARVAGSAPLYVVANLEDVDARWEGLPPKQHLDVLRASPGIDRIGRVGPWSLLRVRDVRRG